MGLKFRDEPINWTKWCVREGWNDRTVKRYIGVYEECLRHPEKLNWPLAQFYDTSDLTKDDYLNDPIQIGCVLHVHYVTVVGRIELDKGDQVELVNYDPTKTFAAEYYHSWRVLTGKHKDAEIHASPINE